MSVWSATASVGSETMKMRVRQTDEELAHDRVGKQEPIRPSGHAAHIIRAEPRAVA